MHRNIGEPLINEGPDLIRQIDQIIEREGGIIEAYVPIDLINQEDVAVDQEHVVELIESIQNESARNQTTGQLTPVLLGQVPGESSFRIIDGFHRVPAVKGAGNEIVYATVKTNCEMEDVIDLRIVAAKSHKKVKFSRIVEWVEEAWQTTPWADRISVSSAFVIKLLGQSGLGQGKGNGLSPEDVDELREWVERKCEQWDVSANYVDRYLRTARAADPELVRTARERTSGHKLEALTPMHLTQIVRHLPNDYTLQNVVSETAIRNNLKISQTQALALAISKAKTYEDVVGYVDTKIWERMTTSAQAITKKRYKEIDPNSPNSYVSTLVDKFFDEQITIVEALLENAILKGTYAPDEDTSSQRITAFLINSDVEVEEIPDLPEAERMVWSQERVQSAAEKMLRIQPFLSKMIRRQFPFNEADTEDILSVATMRFLDRVNDGRLPEEYSEEANFRKLMAKFATYAAIDEVRKLRGREGQKPVLVSIHEEDDEGFTLEDRLGSEDPDIEAAVEDLQDNDFVKNLLPFLNERQRRVLIMFGHFGLNYQEIANLLGTKEGTVAVCFGTLKRKAIELSDQAQAEVISLTA
jgi:RNA polymerase sigma factor (sigma-70 family)